MSRLEKGLRFSDQLPLVIVGCAFALAVGIGSLNYREASVVVNEGFDEKFSGVLEARSSALSDYLESIEQDVRIMAANPLVINAIKAFDSGWDRLGPNAGKLLQRRFIAENPFPVGHRDRFDGIPDGTLYTTYHASYHGWFRAFIQERGYYDLFLFDTDGNLLYTVFKEDDYATNLVSGRFKDTDLGMAFQAALESAEPGEIAYFDFRPYAPSHDAPASFIASPVFDVTGDLVGVFALQMPIDRINRFMGSRVGLGETGETYLVGTDGLMRNDSRLTESTTILTQVVDTKAVANALEGGTGILTERGYRGERVLSAYKPFEFLGTRWALVVEASEDEVKSSLARMRNAMFIAAAVMLVVIATIGSLLARRITKPMAQITSAMRRLATDGDAEVPKFDRDDEVAELADALEVFKENMAVRRKAEEALRTSERRLLAILGESPIGVSIGRPSTNSVAWANNRFMEMFGRTEEQTIGSDANEYYVDVEERYALLDRLERDGYVRSAEIRTKRLDGTAFWSLMSFFPLEYEGETCRLSWYYDVTELKEAEAALREAKERAEETLDELQSAQSRLVHAEKMASLGRLTAGIAHEIKNPLNFINNFSELNKELLVELEGHIAPARDGFEALVRDDIDELFTNLSENLGRITAHGHRADSIVRSMLEHSRGDAGERKNVDLNNLVDESLNLAYHGARAQDNDFNVDLERDYDESVGRLEVAPQDLIRVLVNLFDNGFHATRDRARRERQGAYVPTVRVTTRALNGQVQIVVWDNGVGISAQQIELIFDPFYTSKPTGEGTGLGLSLGYDTVVQQHGGELLVESREGEYTQFTVVLPRG